MERIRETVYEPESNLNPQNQTLNRLARALGQPPDPERLVVYGERLADLDANTLLAVFEQSGMECKFFPQISGGTRARPQVDAHNWTPWTLIAAGAG